jgi:hypothetical protein
MSIKATGTGPSTLRTFTFPDADATILTSFAAVTPAQGGTGIASYAIGDLLYASGAATFAKLADVAAGSYLRSGGVGVAPAWSALILPNAAAAGDLMVATSANTIGSVVDVATGSVLVSGGVGVAPAWSASPTVTKLLAGDGTALLPSLTFASQPTQGLYSRSASYLGLTIQAVERVGFNISGLTLQAAGAFGFSSNTDPGTGPDTTLTRGGAGKLAITGTTPMLQLGGTTSSFPALKRSGAQLQARLADDTGYADYIASFIQAAGGLTVSTAGNVLISAVAPTIASGFGTTPSIGASNGSASFTVVVGSGGVASSGVLTLPAATNGWNCSVTNLTAAAAHRADNTVQTASTTTSVTLENQTKSTGAAVAWTAGDVLRVCCFAY